MSGRPKAFENRWLVTATLVTASPLLIRTGELEPRETTGEEEEAGSVNLVERDAHGLPYIPGTSLKGAIRAWLVTRVGLARAAAIEKLFGREPRDVDDADGQQGQGGRLEFHDAFMAEGEEPTHWIKESGSTAIDPATGAAERRKLRYTELVQTGARLR